MLQKFFLFVCLCLCLEIYLARICSISKQKQSAGQGVFCIMLTNSAPLGLHFGESVSVVARTVDSSCILKFLNLDVCWHFTGSTSVMSENNVI